MADLRDEKARWECRIQGALQPEAFIPYGAAFAFVRGLEILQEELASWVAAEPAAAVEVYEAFLAGCHERAGEIDDSSGNFGEFVQELFGGWVRARQAAGADPDDTAARLVRRMEEDRYGYCFGLEREIVKAFDAPGLASFACASQAQFDAAPLPRSPAGRQGDLMKFVPEPDRALWHGKAIEAADGADLQSLLHLLAETGEVDRLAAAVRRATDAGLEGVSHHVGEPAAVKLEEAHPDAAARLWNAQGLRILQAKRSRYYDAALGHFERARRCYEAAGLHGEWQRIVTFVRGEHRRKRGFMDGFEEVVAGGRPSQRPSFLERARARWGEG